MKRHMDEVKQKSELNKVVTYKEEFKNAMG